MGKLFGGSSSTSTATEDAQKSRELQRITNQRQLAAQQNDENKSNFTRRAKRGRKLFSSDDGKTDLS